MWNEFMEWVDEWGNPIPISDEDEDEDNEEEGDEDNSGLGLGLTIAALPLAAIGDFLGTKVVAPAIKKRREKRNADKKNETS